MAGKTEEAQSDLARLALIKKQRAEAQEKREIEKAGKLLLHSTMYNVMEPRIKHIHLFFVMASTVYSFIKLYASNVPCSSSLFHSTLKGHLISVQVASGLHWIPVSFQH